ncbi:phage holin family protein [Enterobacter cloacae complex sp. ECC445]|uniref:putative holin n=2 Tax=Enterobacter cloacae complex TaxID=354276 RepID=UPI000F668C1C|nr:MULTISPECIES: putative holin [Enterobacter cloacae complex]GJL40150.1 hypothetical protein TUM17577_13590 [Enterobacter asburiae]MBT1936029.1 hypothetical protein [Enterobacter chengduensis]MCG0455717.1 phage holin family protein [Enterobacter cloacae complex sp. ECC445]MCK6818654.1 phage holin family protein [Enterobacter chengduensis]MCK7169739.1 phage holin family protein [Enterobacter chengduensis]
MAMPVTEHTEKTAALLIAGILGLSHHESGIIIGAFAGSLIFAVSASNKAIWARVILFTASMLTGITSAEFAASLLSSVLSKLLQHSVITPAPVGATLAAAASVRLLKYLSIYPARTLTALNRFKREEKE